MKDVKIYDKHVAFWGSPFSNFYECKFVEGDNVWSSSEQCFMAKKAIFFGDRETFLEIIQSKTPKEAKKLGRKVKNFDEKAWSEVSFNMMYEAVYAKFSQNEDLKTLLLSEEYENKSFVEGSPYDAIWGVKMYWNNPKIDDENNWKGENKLGKVLDKVREELKKPSYE
jgi:ribA/ribD-fused uncharacterized protein